MEKASGEGGKPATRFGFDFSWADEVEREEREEQQQLAMERQGREAKKEQQRTRADPFGAARPREVVLAEKGVDWRARDRELDTAAAKRGPRHAALPAARAPKADTAASSRARTIPAAVCDSQSTPTRRAKWDRGSGRTSGLRRHDAELTPRVKDALPVSRSAWCSGKRKCAGEVPALATALRVQAVGDQGRRVFGELNVGEVCGSSFRSALKKSCNSSGVQIEGSKVSAATAVADDGARGCSATATAASKDQSVASRKRKGKKKGRSGGSKKTENQQALLI